MAKLASRLPKGDGNGLAALSRKLIDDPHEVHVVIALVDCQKVTVDTDEGTQEPTARIRRIEVITDGDKDQAEMMLRRALEKRTGKSVLPFDLEQDVRKAFADFDTRDADDRADRGDHDEEPGS